jgi:hypothetical protein
MTRLTGSSKVTAAGLFVVGVLFTLLWVLSCRWTVFYSAQFGDSFGLKAGEVFALWTSEAERARLAALTGEPVNLYWNVHGARRRVPMQWVPWPRKSKLPDGSRSMVSIPLLPLAAICISAGLWVGRRHTAQFRASRGLCLKCGYDRRGLAKDAACPECGNS